MARLAETRGVARITRHAELVIQRAAPTIRIGDVPVLLPPGAFLQATAKGEATLAQLVADHAGKAKIIADLFCGLGPFSLPNELAQWLGCGGREVPELVVELGYRRGQDGLFRGPRRRQRMKHRQKSST